MSLVHQVLKDIDQREQPEPVVPQAFVLPQENTHRSYFSPWLIIPAFVLVSGVAGYFIAQENAADSPTSVKLKYQSIPEIQPEVNFSFVENIEHSSQALEAISTASAVESLPITTIEPPLVKAAEEKVVQEKVVQEKVAQEKVAQEPKPEKSVEPKTVKAIAPTIKQDNSDSNSSHFEIHRDDQKIRTQYLNVKNAMRYGQWQKAEALNAELLAHKKLPDDIKNKSLSNQLRIYLEQKKFDHFFRLYQQNSENRDESWLTTLAPGLHIAGAYQDAINSYQQLIKLQPQKADWPVALASAFEQNQQPDQAMAVLSEVLDRYVLSPSQRQWLEQKRTDLR